MTLNWIRDAVMLARLTRDLPGFLRRAVTCEAAAELVQQRVAARDERFLDVARRLIFDNPRSPYRPLLRTAGCEFGDLQALVARVGLEGALGSLADAGVCVSFDEFKGRDTRRFAFAESDFDNPSVTPHIEIRRGGTRGPATSVKIGLPFIADQAVDVAVALEAQGLSDYAHALWLLSSGVTVSLRLAKTGRWPAAWFYPLPSLTTKLKVGSRWLASIGRLPVPRYLDLREPERLARWLPEQNRNICLTCYASSAVRICRAAVEQKLSLERVNFWTFGEPMTEAKLAVIHQAGARATVPYGLTEAGLVAFACAQPSAPDDMHLFRDAFAMIQRPRAVGETGATVPAFLLTGLLETAPKILLNVEPGDHGTLTTRRCGCPLDQLGLTEHISYVRSYEKLSSEGMTFVKTDLLRVLEQVLPQRFGGAPADYQLLEQEDVTGILRLHLLVNPVVGPVDEAAVRHAFLEALAEPGGYAPLGADFWRRAETLQVKCQPPVATRAGKILPFHLIKS